jgi:hypothetical protein
MSCKSALCLRCAKVYVDNWVSQVSQMLHEGVIYRHIVLTVPAMLRDTFYYHSASLLSAFMRCGVRCLDEVFSQLSGYTLKGGYIVVIQPTGETVSTTRICTSWRRAGAGTRRPSAECIWSICPG